MKTTQKNWAKTVLFTIGLQAALSTAYGQLAGSLDLTYNTTGYKMSLVDDYAYGSAMEIQADGKILMAGRVNVSGFFSNYGIQRYNADGSVDNTFDTDGATVTDVNGSGGFDYLEDIAVQPDGKILAVGSVGFNLSRNIGLVRYNADGSLDNTFNGTGSVITDINGLGKGDVPRKILIQADGNIVVIGGIDMGTASIQSYSFFAVRYTATGALDNSFNGTGVSIIDLVATDDDQASGGALQADGKIVLAGYMYTSPTSPNGTIVRLNTDGSLDNSFASVGYATNYNTVSYEDVLIQPDGKIVAGGTSLLASGTEASIVRYNTDGQSDLTFSADGLMSVNFGLPNEVGTFYSIGLQSNGKIVAVGFAQDVDPDIAVSRINSDGTIDNTFDQNGTAIFDFTAQDEGNDLKIQADGQILIGGTINGGSQEFLTMRLNASFTGVAGDCNGDGAINGTEIAGDIDCSGSIERPIEVCGDTDGDGAITASEIAGDQDGNGTIDRPTETCGDLNADGDAVDVDEIAGDQNGDGTISFPTEVCGDLNGDADADDSDETAGDQNGDGTINRPTEVCGDTNGNGLLDVPTEIAGDQNGDGTISFPTEVCGDLNGDGDADDSDETAGDQNGNGTIENPEAAGDTNGNGVIDNNEDLGIAENSSIAISIFPVPTSSDITVSASEIIESILILDQTGRIVLTNADIDAFETTINTTQLAEGNYQIIITTATTLQTKSIAKLN